MDVASFEQEVIANAVREIGLVHIATSVGLGSDDVVSPLSKIEPISRAVVELKTDLRPSVILWNAVRTPT